MTPCPHCSRESDRLAPLLTSRLAEVNRALGLDLFALHEERLRRIGLLLAVANAAPNAVRSAEPDTEREGWMRLAFGLDGMYELHKASAALAVDGFSPSRPDARDVLTICSEPKTP